MPREPMATTATRFPRHRRKSRSSTALRSTTPAVFILRTASISASAGSLPDGIIHTIAGTGYAGYNGENGISAALAFVNNPRGIALDASGSVYFVDSGNHRIREIMPDGTIQTVAGSGSASYSGDGGLAIKAGLGGPWGLVIDASGNFYVRDTAQIRMITAADGIIRTIVGNGDYAASGDGGPAIAAGINPMNFAVDANGTLYIADEENGLIRTVTPDGMINTAAGTIQYSGDGGPACEAQFNQPQYVTFDSAGNLYISDTYNHRVRKMDSGGNMNTVVGSGLQITNLRSGPALQVNLGLPTGLVLMQPGIFTSPTTGSAA